MKRKIIIIIIALFILIISNIANMFLTFGKWYVFSTENEECVLATIPTMGRDTKYLNRNFKRFKKEHPEYKDLVLYRTFKMELWKFWKWYEYYIRDEYRYPYIGNHANN